MASWIKSLTFSDSDSDISKSEVRERNANIGDRVFVDGAEVFQDPNGAPVEQASPLGYHVGWFGILFLNVSQMVGTGVFSTRMFPANHELLEVCLTPFKLARSSRRSSPLGLAFSSGSSELSSPQVLSLALFSFESSRVLFLTS